MLMNRLIAFPTKLPGGLDASLSAHFGSCACFTLVEFRDGKMGRYIVLAAPAHDDGGCNARVSQLTEHGVSAVVASGIGGHALSGLQSAGIAVYETAPSFSIPASLAALGFGELSSFAATTCACHAPCGAH
jgi:predicted Fe-Mo cluster-binding NifX family protein